MTILPAKITAHYLNRKLAATSVHARFFETNYYNWGNKKMSDGGGNPIWKLGALCFLELASISIFEVTELSRDFLGFSDFLRVSAPPR